MRPLLESSRSSAQTCGTMSRMANEPIVSRMYPRLVVSDAAAAIDFYIAAFGAKEIARHTEPAGKIVHAELGISGLTFAIKDEDDGDPSPTGRGGRLADPYGHLWMITHAFEAVRPQESR